jgi:hypothetical protein
MLKSILAAALVTSVFATGVMAAAPSTNAYVSAKPATTLVHKTAMKKMLHHCKKGMHMHKGKCVK